VRRTTLLGAPGRDFSHDDRGGPGQPVGAALLNMPRCSLLWWHWGRWHLARSTFQSYVSHFAGLVPDRNWRRRVHAPVPKTRPPAGAARAGGRVVDPSLRVEGIGPRITVPKAPAACRAWRKTELWPRKVSRHQFVTHILTSLRAVSNSGAMCCLSDGCCQASTREALFPHWYLKLLVLSHLTAVHPVNFRPSTQQRCAALG